MTTLREAAQQALEALDSLWQRGVWGDFHGVADNLRATLVEDAMQKFTDVNQELEAALAEPVQEPDLSRCPQCGDPADNGHDRSIPPNPYWCTKCMAEPVPDSKHATIAEWWADKQRKPLTEEEALNIARTFGAQPWPPGSCVEFARAIERAHGIKDD